MTLHKVQSANLDKFLDFICDGIRRASEARRMCNTQRSRLWSLFSRARNRAGSDRETLRGVAGDSNSSVWEPGTPTQNPWCLDELPQVVRLPLSSVLGENPDGQIFDTVNHTAARIPSSTTFTPTRFERFWGILHAYGTGCGPSRSKPVYVDQISF